jgi:WD40 repeat protein/energy-coupling factor transporter ATP-binding protein EcfA2
MRYLRGGNLLTSLESGPWNPDPAVKLLDQVASALSAAHLQGVVHRDIKPANILLDESSNAFLSDFGIAKDLTGEMQLTMEGAILGTPDYISPEQIKNDPVSPQTDIYSLGAVMYEILTGEKPFPDSSIANLIHSHLTEPMPMVSMTRPDVPPEIDSVIQKATAKDPADRYADALEMAEAFRRAIRGVPGEPGLEMVPISTVGEIYNPYKGLKAFQESDADDFFGRETLVEQLVARLTKPSPLGTSPGHPATKPSSLGMSPGHFLAVVGPSGSGKSSVVKAGLIPALRSEVLPGSDKWFVAEMVPGTHPLEELELALWPVAVDPPPSLVEPMQKDIRGMLRTVRRVLPGEEDAQLLLVIDQFEELFTLVDDDDRRSFFLDSLITAISAPRSPLRVVITLRADFYDRPLQHQRLGQLIKENTEIVLPLTPEELIWAVQEPARRVGVILEPGLAPAIVGDVADQPGSLPLLQYALTELFERRQDHQMTRTAYQEIGGVLGALGRRAEEIYSGLDLQGQDASRQLFLRMVTLGEGVEDTRRRVLRSELVAVETSGVSEDPEVLSDLIIQFGSARLLTFDHDPVTRSPTVEVAHEALLREWNRLRSWLDESRNDVRMQRMLAGAAAEWAEADEDPGFLLRDARLNQFAGWAENSTVALTQDESAFLQSSITAREARLEEEGARRRRELETAQQLAETEHARAEEQAQSAGRLRKRAALLAGALVVAAVLAIAAVFFANQSSQNADEALANADLAATREAEALVLADSRATAQANAEAQRQRADEQRDAALEAESQAEAQSEIRATAEAVALLERNSAEEQAALATSRELAAASLANLELDPELSVILALQALSATHTIEAEQALHQAVQHSRVRQILNSSGELPSGWMTMTPDGQRLYISGANGGAMWDVNTGDILFSTAVEMFDDSIPEDITEFWINRADTSPDGALLALPIETWIDDEELPGQIAILDAETGQEILTFQADDESGLHDLTFSPDGSLLASASYFGSVKVWDVPASLSAGAGQELISPCCHDGQVNSVNFSPDGSRIVTAGQDGTIRVWDSATGDELYRLEDNAPDEAVFSPDGQYIIVAGDSQLSVFDATISELYSTAPGPSSNNIVLIFNPDGTQLAASNSDGKVRIWNYAEGELDPDPLILTGHKGLVGGIAFTPDGHKLASSSFHRTVRLWDVSLDGGSEFGTYAHDGRVNDIAFSPDGSWLATVSADGTAKIWDVKAREERFTLEGHDDWVVGLDIHPEGHELATGGEDGTVRIWNAETGEQRMVIPAHETGHRLGSGAKSVSYSPDGEQLATGGGDKVVRVWDLSSGDELLSLTGHTDNIMQVDYSPDDRWLISASVDGTVKVWDPEDGRELWTLPSFGSITGGANFSWDGTRLVTGHGGGQAVLWSFPDPGAGSEAQPELIWQIQHSPQWVIDGGFSPDGSIVVIPSLDHTSLHDAHTGELLVDLGHASTAAVFSPDGRIVATAGTDGYVRLLAASLDELVALARSRAIRSLTEEECQQYLHLDACPADRS